jgi:hypothetical protein
MMMMIKDLFTRDDDGRTMGQTKEMYFIDINGICGLQEKWKLKCSAHIFVLQNVLFPMKISATCLNLPVI